MGEFKMKCMLINPSNSTVYGMPMALPYPPLGLLYIAGSLEREHKVCVYDYDIDLGNDKKLKEALEKEKPDVVGLTANTATIVSAKSIAKSVKEVNKGTLVFIGGIHATMDPDYCIEVNDFDFVLRGEAEHTSLALVNHIADSKFEEIGGLLFKRDGKVVKNKDASYIENLDELPFPARHLVKNPSAYVPPNAKRLPVAAIMTSRGCAGRCTFCCTKYLLGSRFRSRSPENVIEEIRYCVEKYGIKEAHIVDDVFTFNKERVLKIRDLMKESGLDVDFVLFNGVRADQVDIPILKALKDLGVYQLGFGCESGSQEILNNIKKGEKLDTIRNAYKMAREIGFETWAYFILGLPGETEETIKETMRFAKEIDADFPKFHILAPYPNSEVYNELKEKNLIDDFNYENYGIHTKPVHHLPSLSAEDIVRWQKKAYRSFYLRPKIIWKNIKRINSFTQLKLNFNSAMFILKQAGVLSKEK